LSTVRLVIALAFALAAFEVAAYGQTNPKEVVRQSVQNYLHDWRQARASLAYTQTDVTMADDTKEIEVSQIFPLCGTPYERLTRKDGHPLTPAEQRKEDRKYDRARRQREAETAAQREARIRKYDSERSFVNDIPEAYTFKAAGEETVGGRPAWVITMTPRPGFTPTTPHGGMLAHIEGKLWIDKEDVRWAKAEAHVTDTIGIGWILARVEPGTRFTVDQIRVEPGLWMPRRITIHGAAHVMLVHSKSLNEELTYSGYHQESSAAVVSERQAPAQKAVPAQSFRRAPG
jgi:hypothetical protein